MAINSQWRREFCDTRAIERESCDNSVDSNGPFFYSNGRSWSRSIVQNKNHLKTPCNETSPSQWVSSLGLASISLFFLKKCQFPSMIPSHFVGVIYGLLLLTRSSLSWRLQMTQQWRQPLGGLQMKLTLNKHKQILAYVIVISISFNLQCSANEGIKH